MNQGDDQFSFQHVSMTMIQKLRRCGWLGTTLLTAGMVGLWVGPVAAQGTGFSGSTGSSGSGFTGSSSGSGFSGSTGSSGSGFTGSSSGSGFSGTSTGSGFQGTSTTGTS